jgi:NADH-quinone oxidoreductase subunit H
VLKQEMVPLKADRVLYMISPVIAFAACFTMFAVIPVGEQVWLSNVPIAVLLLLGLSSLAAYGLILAGWSSQSRYPFLGSLRTCAQVISYELALGLTLLVPVMLAGSLNFNDIGNLYFSPNWNPLYLLVLIPAALLFLIASCAETGRVPFDLPECEAEIVAGYHTEYSSMKYAMFPMGEYIAMTALSAVAVHMFMGGYHIYVPSGPDLSAPWHDISNWAGLLGSLVGMDENWVLGPPTWLIKDPYWASFSIGAVGFSTVVTFLAKLTILILVFMWVRATLPRLRYDQLMRLGWKFMLPAGLVLVFFTAVLMVFAPPPGNDPLAGESAPGRGNFGQSEVDLHASR